MRGRLAPSPTGALHLGGAATFLVAWLEARKAGGSLVMRVEDLDLARVKPGSAEALLADLRWLGLDWDEGPDRGGPCGPYTQSERGAWYERAIRRLGERGHLYYCDCSRAEVARAASAPHGAADEGPRYAGTCRAEGLRTRPFRRPPAMRFCVPEGRVVRFVDGVQGAFAQDVSTEVGDFVVRRGDGVVAYQLAVVVDDEAMDIECVVRGADLLSSTPRQALLREALGYGRGLAYVHTPLLVGADGERLAKRSAGVPVIDQRASLRSPEAVIGALAGALGLDDGRPRSAAALLAHYDRQLLRRGPVRVPGLLVA